MPLSRKINELSGQHLFRLRLAKFLQNKCPEGRSLLANLEKLYKDNFYIFLRLNGLKKRLRKHILLILKTRKFHSKPISYVHACEKITIIKHLSTKPKAELRNHSKVMYIHT